MQNTLRQYGKITIIGITISILLPCTSIAGSLINLGTLDVKPVVGGEYINVSLTPGQAAQQQIRISNFSRELMHLQAYVTDAEEDKTKGFIANEKNQISRDISTWIALPTQELDLASGESKILSVNIQPPENTGIGMHTGAIMVSQKILTTSDNNLTLEKGLRIYADIKGKAAPSLRIHEENTSQNDNELTYSAELSNDGNTDLKGSFTLKILDQSNQITSSQDNYIYLRPSERQSLNISTIKPQLGIYQAAISHNLLSHEDRTTNLGIQLFTPPHTIAVSALLIIVAIIALLFRKRKSAFAQLFRHHISKLRLLEAEKTLTFGFVLITAVIVTFNFSNFPNNYLKVDIFGDSKQSYITTIKWGNLSKHNLPKNLRTDWQGSVKFENAIIDFSNAQKQKTKDQFTINTDRNTLFFHNSTESEIDTLDLVVTPTSGEQIKIAYKNNLSDEDTTFSLKKTIKEPKNINFKAHQISFSSAPTSLKVEAPISDKYSTDEITNQKIEKLDEQKITEEQLASEVKVLNEIITDIPASSENLSEYVLNSDYVQQVSSENLTTTVTADPLLINALQDAPATIADVTASQELNFIFVPDQKVRFATQDFSFTDQKTIRQNLGQIIFVQNKTNDWNTYLSVTDLVSVSGRNSIPASNITITPGDITMISGDNTGNMIRVGTQKTPTDDQDSVLLANITPLNGQEATFSLNPQFTIRVPAGTKPGIYRAQVTIKVL